jgi:peptide deformylase
MLALMLESNGIGLASSQVGIHKRFFVGVIDDSYGVFFNPRFESLVSVKTPMSELCLSLMVPHMVRRYERIRAIWTNWNGTEVSVELSGQNAQMWQHECQHLDGIPFSKMK